MSTTFENRDAKRQRRRRKARQTLSASEIVARTAWLDWQCVNWAGGEEPGLDGGAVRPVAQVLAAHLQGQRPGLYALHLQQPDFSIMPGDSEPVCTPRVADSMPVSRTALIHAEHALKLAARSPQMLTARVGLAPEAWLAGRFRALRHVQRTWQANAQGGLAREAAAPWIGDPQLRPSCGLRNQELLSLFASGTPLPREAAAVLLCQRRAVPSELRCHPWRRFWETLAGWPIELLMHPQGQPQTALHVAKSAITLGGELAVALVRDHALLTRNSATCVLLPRLIPLLEALQRLDAEPTLRTNLACDFIAAINDLSPLNIRNVVGGLSYDLPGFRDAAAILFEDSDAYALPDDAHTTLHGVFRWFLGFPCVNLPAFDRFDLEQIRAHLPSTIAVPGFQARLTVALLSIRLCLFAEESERLADFANWLDCCRQSCAPGVSGQAAMTLATLSLRNAAHPVLHAGRGLGYLADLLRTHGQALCRAPQPITQIAIFAKARLPETELRFVMENRLVDFVSAIYEERAEALLPALAFVRKQPATWWNDYRNQSSFWHRLLALTPVLRDRLLMELAAIDSASASWQDLRTRLFGLVLPYADYEARRYRFMVQNLWLVDAILANPAHAPMSARVVMTCMRWARLGYGDPREAADVLLARLRECKEDPDWGCVSEERLALLLCMGDPKLLVPCLEGCADVAHEDEPPRAAWRFLRRFPELRGVLSAYCEDRKLVRKVRGLLAQLQIALQSDAQAARDAMASLADAVCHEDLSALMALRRLQQLPVLPSAIRKIMNRPQALIAEYEKLAASDRSPAKDARFQNIAEYLSDSTRLAAWIRDDLRRELPRHLSRAVLDCFGYLCEDIIERHWRALDGRCRLPRATGRMPALSTTMPTTIAACCAVC